MTQRFPSMIEKVPEGVCGGAQVEHFEVSKAASQFTAIRGGWDYVPPGRYARLLVDGRTMMSDTHMEQATNWPVIRQARGDVLIAGLGLGMILWPIVAKPEVRSVLVVELRPDVIALVGPHIPQEKVTVIQGDIHQWRPEKGRKFDVLYFDIWPALCTDNLDEVAKLHQRFKYHKALGGWMGSWAQDYLRSVRVREQAEERYYRSFRHR